MTGDRGELDTPLQYATTWFAYHAGQRLATFNFFLVIEGAIVIAYLQAVDQRWTSLGVVAGVVGTLVAVGFYLLELRNAELVNCGREALDALEGRLPKEARIRQMDRSRDQLKQSMGWPMRNTIGRLPTKAIGPLVRHGVVLRTLQGLFVVAFILGTWNAAANFPWTKPSSAASRWDSTARDPAHRPAKRPALRIQHRSGPSPAVPRP